MIVRGAERVLVMGITGKQGTFWTERMLEYGTAGSAGRTQGAGETRCGVPVYASPRGGDAAAAFEVAVLFIRRSA